LATTVIGLIVFLALAAAVGQRIVDAVLHQMRRRNVGVGGWVTMAIGIALGLGAVTQALGVEAVLGAFIGGILLGRSRYAKREVEEQLETFTVAIVAPIFFATAGLRVDLSLLADPEIAFWAIVVTVIASISKFAGSLIGARLSGLATREGMALGTALNARGALEIVIATVGLSLGVLNDASYTIVVIMAIATSVMAPPLLRTITKDWVGSTEEQARLEREQQMARKVLLRPGRVLFASDGSPASAYAARLIDLALPSESPVTVVSPRDDDHVPEVFSGRELERISNHGNTTAHSVLAQAALGYQVIAAAIDVRGNGALPAEIDAIVTGSTLPAILVQPGTATPARVRNILLPVSPTQASRAASEVAIGLAASTDATLHLIYVGAAEPSGTGRRAWRATMRTTERQVGSYAGNLSEQLFIDVEEAAALAAVSTRRVSIAHDSRGAAIVAASHQHRTDLIVLGVVAQNIAGQTFLGQTTEHVLRTATNGVVVVAL
jgi:nucleotide-binding universal stress UspA family protein